MAQAGRTRKLRKTRGKLPQTVLAKREVENFHAAIKRGVVEGASAVDCEVCGKPSEGWAIEAGKQTWYHFSRLFNCTRKVGHVES
jgi:hypothetical protein